MLTPQPDRSIIASGNKDKGVYTVEFKTDLKEITGFRLEALTDAEVAQQRSRAAAHNGNFVLTEFEIKVAPESDPTKSTNVKIASGKADYLQPSFSAEATFDGQNRESKRLGCRRSDRNGSLDHVQAGRTDQERNRRRC